MSTTIVLYNTDHPEYHTDPGWATDPQGIREDIAHLEGATEAVKQSIEQPKEPSMSLDQAAKNYVWAREIQRWASNMVTQYPNNKFLEQREDMAADDVQAARAALEAACMEKYGFVGK